MRLSAYFLPTLREDPSEAQIISHRLMLRAGMIYQTSSGIYSWLPLGLRVLKNIEKIVREEQDRAGAQEVLFPTIQSMELWKESGRVDAYGPEMLRMMDRHEREMLYSPTAEELVTDIARKHLKSYRDIPQLLYQIQWKFRDEIRPRFGVMRGREFLMKDCYSFDMDEEGARLSYRKMMEAYVKTFHRMGLTAVPVRAKTGAIGGDLSHEFHVLAQTGESSLFYDQALDQLIAEGGSIDVDRLMTLYAMEEEMHDPATCSVPQDRLKQARGIEVGHIFYFGTKYTEALKAYVANAEGQKVLLHMGSYGIGISRLVGALIEAHHDKDGIVWPASVAPFKIGLLNLRQGDAACDRQCSEIYETLTQKGVSVLYDDRAESAGVKFSNMDLIGLPWQVRVGPKGLKNNQVEIKNRKTGEVQEVALEAALSRLMEPLGK